ncbi:hypothetical protein E2P81_ATG09620 [Venturia nashicola]|uniref:Uncharacterized protein n=1 Tax=Venturia nashicola TaxID=86259 RepID=A0A4Z1NUN5_9PEZI|nr:hypothetical protein E6O75_ATG09831 [Venturia nashicola]TLD25963.1 hypothetical protein E2P81_ATG09620 [Venturia nashicola]
MAMVVKTNGGLSCGVLDSSLVGDRCLGDEVMARWRSGAETPQLGDQERKAPSLEIRSGKPPAWSGGAEIPKLGVEP